MTDFDARVRLLEEATKLVCGDRNIQYGDPNADFARTADLWSTYLNGSLSREGHSIPITLTAVDVAICMMLLKISRLAWMPEKEDTWVDIAGYAACGFHCTQKDPLV